MKQKKNILQTSCFMFQAKNTFHASRFKFHGKRGQVMILVSLALGGALLGATVIAGMLTANQIRQTTDAADSAQAIFAADAGAECALYFLFKGGATCPVCPDKKDLSNTASYCVEIDTAANTIISKGFYRSATRAFLLRDGP